MARFRRPTILTPQRFTKRHTRVGMQDVEDVGWTDRGGWGMICRLGGWVGSRRKCSGICWWRCDSERALQRWTMWRHRW